MRLMKSTDKLHWTWIVLIGACLMGFWEEAIFALLIGGLAVFILCILFD